MKGFLKIAIKLLINDRAKFGTLLMGITFAVFLMLQMQAVFAGLMQKTSSDIINIGAPLWVMDPSVLSQKDAIPLPSYVLDVVRSMPGVEYAAPIYMGSCLARLPNGRYQAVSVIGLDDNSLLGRPQLIDGSIEQIYQSDAFIAAINTDYVKLGAPEKGAEIELNGKRAVIVGKAYTPSGGLFGVPTLYTTYNRALTYLPQQQFKISYVLVQPQNPQAISAIKTAVKQLGYHAFTLQEFIDMNIHYYKYQTGMGLNIALMTVISFIVGMSIAGQTFYAFVNENVEAFAALKAVGASSWQLVQMLIVQALVCGSLGYGLGTLLSCGTIGLARLYMPAFASMVSVNSLLFGLVGVGCIVIFASYLGIRRILRIDPYEVFRG